MARETEVPNVLTQAYLELPYLIATHGIQERYAQAMKILENHKSRLTLPRAEFLWHATCALIAAARHEASSATVHAMHALGAAARKHSGFRKHAALGLVTKEYDSLIRKLEEYSKA